MKTMTKLGLAVTVFMATAVSNHAQAQTKEETISWLKEKLSKYMYQDKVSNITLHSIDECKIVFNYTYGGNRQCQQILPTTIKDITNEGAFRYSAQVASDQEQGKEAFFSDYSYLKLNEREENIRARVEKALKHLATFCPKKQEAF
ncbi:hypothetical protein [Soonwooa purpurea]